MITAGEIFSVPCEVNISQCGEYHSLKWYRDDVRVGVYSPHRNWYRVEAALQDVKVEADDLAVRLVWAVGGEEEEGEYKCEITYLAVTRCPVVHLVSRLVVVAPPRSLQLYSGQQVVTNSSLGPAREGTELRLRCESSGGRPPALLSWRVGERGVRGRRVTDHVSLLHLNLTRHLLNQRVSCTATSPAARQTRTLTASLDLDLNLSPVSTLITPDLARAELRPGDSLQLVCQTEGARPAATIRWRNNSAGDLGLTEHRTQQIATLQSDGTYVTLSKLVIQTRWD